MGTSEGDSQDQQPIAQGVTFLDGCRRVVRRPITLAPLIIATPAQIWGYNHIDSQPLVAALVVVVSGVVGITTMSRFLATKSGQQPSSSEPN
ncbi:hypothetical protein H9Y04_07210 [Streptomyces sp. TRM66268-LWL]|uniref:Uncharacterized protein n=1 Tax=Streptomyces polyasparticus TaxID=2767826 RepID=A0ABR7SBV0_9ACTN|nr:hypothetical protein [Streptomyces polyasparticus]MBC9712359.1 hypothetical protein [Streptomyces polyasparticus]